MSNATVKKGLLKRRAELAGLIDQRDDHVAESTIDDAEDKAFELLDDEVLSALSDSDRAEIIRIDAALGKIAEGSYGICEECGNDIAPARLKALPDALICIDCATKAEA